MKFFLLSCLFIVCASLKAQNTLLTILGRKNYTKYPDRYLFTVNYPGSESQRTGVFKLIHALDSVQIPFHLDTNRIRIPYSYIEREYEIALKTYDDFRWAMEYAHEMDLRADGDFIYLPTKGEEQDALAMAAYHDAYHKAKMIADHLGKKISRVLNIDDYVDQYLFFYDHKVRSACEIKAVGDVFKLLELLSSPGAEPTTDREKQSQYAMWVTFELE